MDIGLYKRARGIKHKKAMPFYPRSPVATPAAPVQAGNKAKPTAAAPWPMPAPPPSAATAEVVNAKGGPGAGDADVDHLAAMYITRVQERFRRERMNDDWRKYH